MGVKGGGGGAGGVLASRLWRSKEKTRSHHVRSAVGPRLPPRPLGRRERCRLTL